MNMRVPTILIVDDEIRNRRLLSMLLKPEGYLTSSVGSGAEAMASIAHSAPDLILLDIMMPGMDGYTVASMVKANPATSNIPIIMVTARQDRSALLAGLDAGAEDYLTKPVDRTELWLRVRNLLRLKAFGDLQDHSMDLEQQVEARTIDLSRFRAAMDATADAIMLISRNSMGYLEVNTTACAMLGYTREELFRLGPAEIGGETVERLADAYDAVIAHEQGNTVVETEVRRKDGSSLHVEVRRHAHRSGDDWIIVSVLRDITEQKLARDALRESERRFSSMLGNVKLVSLMLDQHARITYCNDYFLQLTGWQHEEVIDQNWFDLFIPPEQDSTRAVFAALLDNLPSAWHHDCEIMTRNGSRRLIQWNNTVLRSAVGDVIGAASIGDDITNRRDAENRLLFQAHHDALTGLPNRTLFYETLQRTLCIAADCGWSIAVLFVDLDHFKNVNDTLGHAVGDELLVQFSNRLLKCVRIRDTVGRLGGDEFAMILLMREEQHDAALVAQKIRQALLAPFVLQGHSVCLTASIGITVHPGDAGDADTLIRYADTAMYRAKHAGRDSYRFFTAQMNADMLDKLELEAALRKAVANQEFVLHYQPKARIDSGMIVGMEALLRWERPGVGLVPPNAFIPMLEETGLIVGVGSWVIGAVCKQIGQWQGSAVGAVQVSVNVTGRQFVEGDLVGDVSRALADNQIAGDLLELELTESSLMVNTDHTITTLQKIRNKGVAISIDDFGTGYSSLAYLRRFPIDKLKIDIAFIRDVTTNPDDAAITLAIIQLAHSLKLEVIAEGVETEAQLSYLRRHRCDQVQGYLLSRPVAVPALEQLLAGKQGLPGKGAVQGPTETILLVDDDPSILAALQRLVRQDGYRVLVADSAAAGFELLALNSVQLIMCDQRMPAMSGTEFFNRVKELYPDTFRIVLSGYTELESVIQSINSGSIHRFYTKPWDNSELRSNLREAFRQYWLLHDARGKRKAIEASPDLPAVR